MGKEYGSMNVYEPKAGESIRETVEGMMALVKEKKGRVRAMFNGHELWATEDSTAAGIFKDYDQQVAEATEGLYGDAFKH